MDQSALRNLLVKLNIAYIVVVVFVDVSVAGGVVVKIDQNNSEQKRDLIIFPFSFCTFNQT